MIANARMYSVTPEIGVLWRRLLTALLRKVQPPIEIIEYPPPLPIADLWARPDKAAVFMCGLPQSLAEPRPALVAAPVPSPAAYGGRACYWTDMVVRVDSRFETLPQTFGHRLALTTPESQSGYAAPLYALMAYGGTRPLYREVVAPAVTPLGALRAVLDGQAEVAPLDSYALALMRRHAPDLVAGVRVIASTEPTAIPVVVASGRALPEVITLFLAADRRASSHALMEALLLTRFQKADLADYDALRQRFETMRAFWRSHPLAETIHPTFAL